MMKKNVTFHPETKPVFRVKSRVSRKQRNFARDVCCTRNYLAAQEMVQTATVGSLMMMRLMCMKEKALAVGWDEINQHQVNIAALTALITERASAALQTV